LAVPRYDVSPISEEEKRKATFIIAASSPARLCCRRRGEKGPKVKETTRSHHSESNCTRADERFQYHSEKKAEVILPCHCHVSYLGPEEGAKGSCKKKKKQKIRVCDYFLLAKALEYGKKPLIFR